MQEELGEKSGILVTNLPRSGLLGAGGHLPDGAKEEELAIQVQPEAGTLAELEGKAEDTGDKDRRLSWRPASKLCLKSSKSQIVWQNRPATENQR